MMQYSVQPRDWILVKGYVLLSFAKNIGENIGKNISKNLIGKWSRKIIELVKQSATDPVKTKSKIVIQKTADANADLTGNKMADET